jgi:quinoprotein dehydrogenase-associated probable ABC transporter substrate-binding protein
MSLGSRVGRRAWAAGRWLAVAAGIVVAGVAVAAARPALRNSKSAFRVCADPNNLPFSDSLGRGFENRIAALMASDFHERLYYTWWPQRRGFVRNTLNAGNCDVVIGVPAGYDMLSPTQPYYQSTYVFVTRADRHLHIASFDDTILEHLRIGIHMMGDDYANSPAAVALMRRGLGGNISGYMIYGNYDTASPPSRLIDAVAKGDVDVAIAWGPLAGWAAQRSPVPLTVTRVSPSIDTPFLPFVYSIAMGVRRGDTVRRALLDTELVHRRADIRRILAGYGVPQLGARR